MHRNLTRVLVLLLPAVLAAASAPAGAEEPKRDANYFARQAMEAYQKKDYPAAIQSFESALDLAPGHPRLLYNLAAAAALAGQQDRALQNLERLSRMQLGFDLEADDDFAALKASPRFRAVSESMKSLSAPRGGGDVAFRLSRPDFIPEGIARDPATGEFFVGSVRGRQVARITKDGREGTPLGEGQPDLWSVLGLGVDASRRILWACTSALPNMTGGRPDEPARGALVGFDLKSGKVVSRHEVAAGAAGHDCNDLTVAPSGAVYLSDSRKGSILMVPADSTQGLVTFLPEGTFPSPQGLALTPDGRWLYVADYSRGLFRVEVSTRAVTQLGMPDDVTSRGVDGLLWHKGSLIGIQNGVSPHRVALFRLDEGGGRVDRQEILGMSHPLYDEPTLGVVVDGALIYVANSQWGKFAKDGSLPAEGLQPPAILKLRLP